jgi:HSP20 family protein
MTRQNGNGPLVVRRVGDLTPRRSPWSEIDTLNRQADDTLLRFLGFAPLVRPLSTNAASAPETGIQLSPDIYETAEEFVYIFALPGVTSADLQIEATAETLSVRGERKPVYQNENATLRHQGRWSPAPTTFQGEFGLPGQVNVQAVTANFVNGVLEIHLPKIEEAKPKAITVNVAAN